jgi:biofilm PGA synthesis N-glycosyltransferase PgaC
MDILESILRSGIIIYILLAFLSKYALERNKKITGGVKISLDQISVIVPFRNEEDRLDPLLESLKGQNVLPEIIFVNDHSEDEGKRLIEESLGNKVKIIDLRTGQEGKKEAIHHGIIEAGGSTILTLDADVKLPDNYFETLLENKFADLNILPVKMEGDSLWGQFFAWEYKLQSLGNRVTDFYNRPIVCSGAHLLFAKDKFLQTWEERNDKQLASGDDQFLLKAFREKYWSVNLISVDKVTLETPSEESFMAGINQRKRWLGKSAKVGDLYANIMGTLVLLLQLIFYTAIVVSMTVGLRWAIVLLSLKTVADVYWMWHEDDSRAEVVLSTKHALMYPLYLFPFLFFSLSLSGKWKGRDIKKPAPTNR